MNAVFVNWTSPFNSKNNLTGHKKDISNYGEGTKYSLPYYEILIQKLAFINAKRFLGLPIKMYTDIQGYEFYKNNDMLKYFDIIDTVFLEELNDSEVDSSIFWTSGKIKAICNEPSPSIFLDLDFILYSQIPQDIFNSDFVCAHWEITRKDFHLTKEQLQIMDLEKYVNHLDMLMPNTCFLLIRDHNIKEKYLEVHNSIVHKNYEVYPEWLWLIPDQHALGFVLRDLKVDTKVLDNRIFVQYPDSFHNINLPGFTPKWVYSDVHYTERVKFNHVWFDKIALKVDEIYRNKQLKVWENELNSYI